MKRALFLVAALAAACSSPRVEGDAGAFQRQAEAVIIIREASGLPHVYGRTDADAIYGLMYAQAEDDFGRVERNVLSGIGRLAEAEGEKEIYRDLRTRLFNDPQELHAHYENAPVWLKRLMNAWADGLNHYLHTHPAVQPRVLKRFEPWMALALSGAPCPDVERVSLGQIETTYGGEASSPATAVTPPDSTDCVADLGSTGIAVAPKKAAGRHALLLINPHAPPGAQFEAQVVSEEGLNAYGVLTWGRFFVYDGFNDRSGWMHTPSGADNIDEYRETIVRKGDALRYKHGAEVREVRASRIAVAYRAANGMTEKAFTVYRTHHGPIVRRAGDEWVSIRLMQQPSKALMQSFTRMKAHDYKEFRETMNLHANSSSNTIYADGEGTIVYFHSNFIPRRDARFDWTRAVDGGDPATEWNGLLSIDDTPHLIDPKGAWLYNAGNWPWSATAIENLSSADFPSYVERSRAESPLGAQLTRVLNTPGEFTLDSLAATASEAHRQASQDVPRGGSVTVVVEFGDRVRARHSADGDLRAVYFSRDEVASQAARTYHPGQ